MDKKITFDLFFKYFLNFVPLWFFLIFAQTLRRSHGHLRLAHLVYLSIFLILFCLYWRRRKSLSLEKENLKLPSWLPYLIIGIFSIELSQNLHLIFLREEVWVKVLQFIFGLTGALSLALIYFRKSETFNKFWFYLVLTVGLIALLSTPSLSPEPIIDVWLYQQKAVDYFVNLQNPYEFKFPHLYGDSIGSTYGFPYWPVVLYLGSIGKVLFGDIRFSFSIISVFMIIYWVLKRRSNLILLWLLFPVQFFVLEQAWTEGLVIPLVFFHLEMLRREKWLLSSVMLGIICAAKQTMAIYFIFHLIFLFTQLSTKDFLKNVIITGAISLCLFSPFLMWNFEAFITETVFDVLSLKARDDSLSWSSYLLKFYGNPINSKVFLAMVIVSLSASAVLLYKRRTLRDFICANIVTYMVVFLFGKQAFCNYYFYIVFLLFYLISLEDYWKKNECI